MAEKREEHEFFLSLKGGGKKDQGMLLGLVLSGAMLAALALSLVWLNIERTKLAYRVRVLQQEMEQSLDLGAKLSIEREHLLSPYELGKKAEALGLHAARPGQIRRISSSAFPENGAGSTGTGTATSRPNAAKKGN